MKQLFLTFLLAIASLSASAQAQQDSSLSNCAVNPGACQPAPVPSDCQPGSHWTLIGSGIAHCVQNDPPCAGGTVNHDALGNPTNCQTSATQSKSCGSGYTGSIKQRRAVYTWMDGSTTYGSWSTTSSTCKEIPPPPEPAPVPTPVPPTSTPTPEPPPTSTPTPEPTQDPQPGVCANGATNYPTCTLPICPNGASDYPTCTPPTCANGASNYPVCTPVVQQPVCQKEIDTRVTATCGMGIPSRWEEREYDVCRYPDGRVTKTESAPLRMFSRGCGQPTVEV